MLDHPHHYIGTILWCKMISARPAGIREKVVENLEMGADTEGAKCVFERTEVLEDEIMNGMDWVAARENVIWPCHKVRYIYSTERDPVYPISVSRLQSDGME